MSLSGIILLDCLCRSSGAQGPRVRVYQLPHLLLCASNCGCANGPITCHRAWQASIHYESGDNTRTSAYLHVAKPTRIRTGREPTTRTQMSFDNSLERGLKACRACASAKVRCEVLAGQTKCKRYHPPTETIPQFYPLYYWELTKTFAEDANDSTKNAPFNPVGATAARRLQVVTVESECLR